MKEFWELLWEYITNGTIPSISTLILGGIVFALEIAKNKAINKSAKLADKINSLESKILDLEEQLNENNEANINTNEIASKTIDMLYVAYANSKLPFDVKQGLQNLYNECPDGLKDAVGSVTNAISEASDAIVETTSEETYLDKLNKKLESE